MEEYRKILLYRKADTRTPIQDMVERRMNTVMIGAIHSIENMLGHLWGHGIPPEKRNRAEALMGEVFEALRTEILDKGNNQKRLFFKELGNS